MLLFASLSLAVVISAGVAFNSDRPVPRALATVEKAVNVIGGDCYVGAKIVVEGGKTKRFSGSCMALTCNPEKLTVTEQYCDRVDFMDNQCSLDFTEYLEEFPWCCPAFKCAVPIAN